MDRRTFLFNGSCAFAGTFLLSPSRSSFLKLKGSFLKPALFSGDQPDPVWLKRFVFQDASSFLWRRKYRLIMTASFAGLQAPFFSNKPIHNTVHRYMSNPGMAKVDHARYFIADGCSCHFGRNRAMLWIDTHWNPSAPVWPAAAAFIDVTQTGRFLWIISNQPFVDQSPHLPVNFRRNLNAWILSRPPKRWEGGPLDYFNVMDASSSQSLPVPHAFGVPPKRCSSSLQAARVPAG